MKTCQVATRRAAAALAAVAFLLLLSSHAMAQSTEYYFNYDADSTNATVPDETGNGHDLAIFFNGGFQYAALSGAVPVVGSARALDVASMIDGNDGLKKGGLTDPNPINEADIYANGGYSFETWIKRNANDGLTQHIWNPEGMHSIEILGGSAPDQLLQFAIRGVAAWTLPVQTVIPAGEWHHIMAVMTAPTASGDVTYQLLVDGVQAGPTLAGNLNASFTTFAIQNARHGIGWNEIGVAGAGLNAQLAYTRLSLGVVPYANSLAFERNIPGFVPEPATLALAGIGALALAALRRRTNRAR